MFVEVSPHVHLGRLDRVEHELRDALTLHVDQMGLEGEKNERIVPIIIKERME